MYTIVSTRHFSMMTEILYSQLIKLLLDTESLIKFICESSAHAEIIIPDHHEIPIDSVGKFTAVMSRFKFKPHEEPYETFSWPGFVYHEDLGGELNELINKANESRSCFSDALKVFKESNSTTSKPVVALCQYHRARGIELPLIGSPDRIKIRQLTRRIRSFHDATRVTFSHDIKNEVTNFDPSHLIEEFHSLGFTKQANELAMFKEGELKKVHPPTERWRANVHYNDPSPIKAHVALPVFFTGNKPEIRGISSGSIPEKRKRAPNSSKKKLVQVVEQYGVFRYE